MRDKRKIPKWLVNYIELEELDKIEASIMEAEKRTVGEVVPVVVKNSSTVGHVPLAVVSIILAVAGFADAPYWISELIGTPYWLATLSLVVLVILVARLLSPLFFIQRWLTPKEDQKKQVISRALNEFQELKIRHTKAATGVLLFVSLMEHQVVVLGDRAINEKIDPADWDKVVETILSGIKNSSLEAGLSRGIKLCGDILAKHFPIQSGDKNELLNHLIVKD